jgi:hypothetical protein
MIVGKSVGVTVGKKMSLLPISQILTSPPILDRMKNIRER